MMARAAALDEALGRAVALVTPGFEDLLAAELVGLGVPATVPDQGPPGEVVFQATLGSLAAVHHASRLAARVRLRLAATEAESLEGLAGRVRLLGWRRYAMHRQAVAVDVTGTGNHLRRRDAVARKVEHAIADALRGPSIPGAVPAEPLQVHIHLDGRDIYISVDASGELLHKRGWRQATAKAPLRETLAAAVLTAAGWVPGVPLVDPFCGSGTLALEAATWAAGLPPGHFRRFAWQDWPLARGVRPPLPHSAAVPTPILLSDRDPGAIRAVATNARRAEVAERVRWEHVAFEDLPAPATPGLLVANLPYGQRIGRDADLDAAYRRWGARMAEAWGGWRVAVITDSARRLGRLSEGARTPFTVVRRFRTGGLPVVLGVADLPGGR